MNVRAIAPAKVNLRLEVLGERPDGYHEIRSTMLAVDLCDALEVRPRRGGGVRLGLSGDQASDDVPADGSNLASRGALAALEEGRRTGAIGGEAGVEIVLEKRIPSRAGLGGGSSDAAAAFVATEAALGFDVGGEARLRALAAIGSDCAFFAAARSTGFALCGGRGERVAARPYATPGIWIGIVTPGVECETALVYRNLAGGPRSGTGNDLEPAAIRAFPELGRWRGMLDALGPWTLSGSGSSFFALFDTAEEVEAAVAAVRKAAGAERLALRGAWAVRPAGHGARLLGTS